MVVDIARLIRIQDGLNEAVTPDWKSRIPVYRLEIALFEEMMELVDSFPWAWWKPGRDNNRKLHEELAVKKGRVKLSGFHEPYKGEDLKKSGEIGIDGP